MSSKVINVKKRIVEGSSSSRRLRSEGILPGVLYGSDDVVPVEMDLHIVEKLLNQHSSDTLLVDISLDGKDSFSVLMKEVQHHPVTSALLHVDLQRVVANKPIQVDVAVELKGEPEGVRAGGLLDHVMHNISIQCLPADLVESIEVDISELDIGDSVYVSDLSVSSKLTIITDSESMVAAVNAPNVEAEESEESSEELSENDSEEASEPEVIGEEKEEEKE